MKRLFKNGILSGNVCSGMETLLLPCIINPRRACTARVTLLGLSVCVSVTILALQATKRHQSNTNSFSATSARKLNKGFC